jgi:hypothetical protein
MDKKKWYKYEWKTVSCGVRGMFCTWYLIQANAN